MHIIFHAKHHTSFIVAVMLLSSILFFGSQSVQAESISTQTGEDDIDLSDTDTTAVDLSWQQGEIDENNDLTKPILVGPENRAVLHTSLFIFSWEPSAGAARYTLEIKNNSDNSVVYKAYFDADSRCSSTLCQALVRKEDMAPGVYKWHVVPWDADRNRGPISSWRLYTQRMITPVLRSPGDGSNVVTNRPTFKWYQSYTATEYVIELLDNGGARVDIWSVKNPTCDPYCEFRIPPADNLGDNTGTYTWWVRARNDERASYWSYSYSFTYE